MRKLATIREIAEIKPISDADRIEVAMHMHMNQELTVLNAWL